jgi:dihydrofolate reductase
VIILARIDGGLEVLAAGNFNALACDQAREAAGDVGVRIGGGVNVIRQYLRAGLVDEIHLAVSPVLLGSDEHLLGGIDAPSLGYKVREHVGTSAAMHVILEKT